MDWPNLSRLGNSIRFKWVKDQNFLNLLKVLKSKTHPLERFKIESVFDIDIKK